MNSPNSFEKVYTKNIIRAGRLTAIAAVILCFGPPLFLYLKYGIFPSVKNLIAGYLIILSMFGISYFTDMIAFYPTTGLSGIYLGYLSGNMSGVRLPVMLTAQEALGTESGSQKAEIVGTIAMGGSVFIGVTCTVLTAIIGDPLMNILPGFVVNSFNYVTPAIMGSLISMVAVKNFKAFIFAVIMSIAVVVLQPPAFIQFPAVIFSTIFVCIMLYKKEKGKDPEKE